MAINLENRFGNIKQTALKGVIVFASLLPYGCTSNHFYSLDKNTTAEQVAESKQDLEKKTAEYVPTLDDFKKVLRKQGNLEQLTKDQETMLNELFSSNKKEAIYDRNLFYEIYTNPEKTENRFSSTLSEAYQSFDLNSVNQDTIKKLRETTPWPIIPKDGKYSKSERLALFLLYSLDYGPWYGSVNLSGF